MVQAQLLNPHYHCTINIAGGYNIPDGAERKGVKELYDKYNPCPYAPVGHIEVITEGPPLETLHPRMVHGEELLPPALVNTACPCITLQSSVWVPCRNDNSQVKFLLSCDK